MKAGYSEAAWRLFQPALQVKPGRTGGLRMDDRSASPNSPYLISCTRVKPSVMTVMFEFTTASPNRPNFFTY